MINVKDNRISVYLSDTKEAPTSQVYIAKLSAKPQSWRSVFSYDKRTKTIRNYRLKNHALSNQSGQNQNKGKNVAFRPFKGKAAVDQVITRQGMDVKAFGNCLTPHNYQPIEGKILTWWNCQGK